MTAESTPSRGPGRNDSSGGAAGGSGGRTPNDRTSDDRTSNRERPKGTILLVDDEAYVRDPLSMFFRRRGYDVREADGATSALAEGTFRGIDAAIVDLRMDDGDGMQVLQALLAEEPGLPVIILTGHGSVRTAVECLKAGAAEFVQKPADPEALLLVVERVIEEASLRREVAYLRTSARSGGAGEEAIGSSRAEGDETGQQPPGTSAGWRATLELARKGAQGDASILIIGESGVGKEEVARYIHRVSGRRDHAFVAVNCGAIPSHLFESEFFGHRRGAFTGATSDRDGRFRVAHQGTLFLDEIGLMNEECQAKVLRVLQDGAFERVGENQTTRVDTRIIAATNADVEGDIEAGRFRQDLYYRIAILTIHIPPLRERRDDIPVLSDVFLRQLSAAQGKRIDSILPETMDRLVAYDWPGNVRELRNVMERAVLLESANTLGPEGLPPHLLLDSGPGKAETSRVLTRPEELSELNLRDSLQKAEKELIEEALRRANGKKREAARLLGVDERNVSYFLKKHGLHKGRGKS